MPDQDEAPNTGETTAADIGVPEPTPAIAVSVPVEGDKDTTWLKLKDTIGVSADGNLEPLVDIGLTIAVPQMIEVEGKQEVGEAVHSLRIGHADSLDVFTPARFIEGGRIVETRDVRVVDALMQTGNWDRIDQPTKTAMTAHVKSLKDASEEAANRSDEER